MNGWISVKDRLPEVGQAVIAYRPLASASQDPDITVTYFTGADNESPQGVKHGFNCWCHPSHWIPLPQPPEPSK